LSFVWRPLNVHRRLPSTGNRNVKTSDWNRPPPHPPGPKRAPGIDELQELPETKGKPATTPPRAHRSKLMLFKDQVQSSTSNVRSLPGVRMSVHLWYASPPRAPDSHSSRAFGNFRALTPHRRCDPQEEGTENRRARSSLEACGRTREASALRGKERCAARRRLTYQPGRKQQWRQQTITSGPPFARDSSESREPRPSIDVTHRAKVPIDHPGSANLGK